VRAADREGNVDQRHVTIDVRENPAGRMPRLKLERDPFLPYGVIVSLDGAPAGAGEYLWKAGEQVARARSPAAAFDLAADINHRSELTIVTVEVMIDFAGSREPIHLARTVTFYSDYQVIRGAGRIVPLITSTGIATRSFHHTDDGQVELTPYNGVFTIENVEAAPMSLTSVSRRWLVGDAEVVGSSGPVELTIQPGEKRIVTLPLGDPPSADATAAVLVLEGRCEGMPVMLEHYFELRTSKARGALLTHWREHLSSLFSVDDRVLSAAAAIDPRLVVGDKLTGRGAWLVSRLSNLSETPVLAVPVTSIDRNRAPEPLSNWKIRPSDIQSWSGMKKVGVGQLQKALSFRNPIARIRHGERRVNIPERIGSDIQQPSRFDVSLDRLMDDVGTVHQIIPLNPAFDFGELGKFDDKIGPLFPHQGGMLEGMPCDPDAMPENVPEGWVCQFAGSYRDVLLPERVMNAKKGDIFLSPGGSGTIGGLLKQVTPSQRYDHCGIFSADRVEVCHSTGSPKWLSKESGDFPTDGLEPSALKYLWPGSIIQSVKEGVTNSVFFDPKKRGYELSAFNRGQTGLFGKEWSLIPPVVVKPVPTEETADIRSKLHAIADVARGTAVTAQQTEKGEQSKRHYRFFLYTDAA
jgi:hypothetical protein